jgi:predicted phosphate transport protein (TIGR00153 family)
MTGRGALAALPSRHSSPAEGKETMSLDSMLRALLPKDDKFFQLLEQDVENLRIAAQTFKDLMQHTLSSEERAQKTRRLEELEHKGDELTHQIFRELGATFITPFDREDIHTLTSALDDILDYINGAATRIQLYKIKKVTVDQETLASMVAEAVDQLHKAIPLLRNLKNVQGIRECLVRVNSIENDADDLFERAIAALFDDCDDPIKLIKLKEVFVSLETATDRCEDAANVIESIIVKNL